MRSLLFLAFTCSLVMSSATAKAAETDPATEAYWGLLHEEAVVEELQLTREQQQAYQAFLDNLDLRFFPLRNHSAEEAQSGLVSLTAEARQKVKSVLQPSQLKRLNEILLWRVGIASLLRDDVAKRMRYTESQQKQIKKIIDETQAAVKDLEKQAKSGQPRGPLEKKFTDLKSDEQTKISKLLKAEQKNTWKELLGTPFDVSTLGNTRFKAPELIDSREWINTRQPLALQKLRGKVVVLHFYASGCINCIHNYPWYHEWSERFQNKDVALIGVHTPETDAERDLSQVRKKAAAEKFTFPVLLDAKSENWGAWGNSMWPCVYVIDKQGYLRTYWAGELKWNGADGEKLIREKIERLLEEPAA